MDDRSRVMLAALTGAVVGGTWGYLYLTEAGRRARTQIEPKLDDFVAELRRMRGTIDKARAAANEGWRSLNDLAASQESGRRWNPNVSH